MKKPFLKTQVGKVLLGGLDLFTGGTASNIAEKTETHGVGEVDVPKVVGAIVSGIVALLLYYLK